ncbi:serine-rich adhesin for platelets-like [Ylistrum balloti]|uniref:serine-rich adhesin for platelets-like n=1 Tax=Ylistrum balloti TaxID=509963 RepID=UPI002905F63A|nr:serine-rich adhesin for platelets-like [Ylistrum balloti]
MVPDRSSSLSSVTSILTSHSSVPVFNESRVFNNMSSSQMTPSGPVGISTNILSPSAIEMTSIHLNLSTFLSSVLQTPSDISSSNSTIMIFQTSVVQMSSTGSLQSINATPTMFTSSMTSSTHQSMPSSITLPTTSDVTTPVIASGTTTPALNTTRTLSVSMTPSVVENMTSSSITSDTVILTNVTMTMSVNMTSTISPNSTEVMSTSMAPVTTVPTTTPTTTTATTTEPPATTNSFMATYWTVTDVNVPVSTNVSGEDFINRMETGLANLYVTAYSRKRDIDAGSFDNNRRRRAVTKGDITVTMQDVTRDQTDPENVSMMYTVDKAEVPVPSAANAETINLVSDQEMAIELQYVVTKKAKPLNWVEPVTTTTTTEAMSPPASNNTQTWIIAVVAAGVTILIVIAIVGLCIATKKKKSGVDEEAEPKLMNLKNAPLDDDEEDIGSSGGRSHSKYSSMADRESSSNLKVQSPKKQSYEITSVRSKEEDEHLYAEVKKPKKPDLASRIGKSKGSQDGLETEDIAEDAELIKSPKKKKGEKGKRRNKRKDGELEDEEKEVITKTVHPANLLVPQSEPFAENAYYSAEEEDELKKRKAAERKKNKQRIREKKKKEKRQDKSADQLMVEYLAAQEEIDSVLEAPPNNEELPDVFIHKKKKEPTKSTLQGHDNMALSAEESLNVARSRMHELLDDAFSLISPSAASITQNQPPEDEGFHSPRTQSPRSPRSQLMLLNQRNLNKVYPADVDAIPIGNNREDLELYGSEVILVDSRAPSPYSGHDIFLARSSSPVSSSESISVPEDTTSTGSYDVRGSSTTKHSPLKMESYKGEPILQTWSPYRAADQVALISMPNKMQTTIGRTPSGRTKRPAADLVGKKSKDSVPKPAFLKSRDLISSKGSTVDLSSTKSQNGDVANRTSKSKSVSSENTDEQEGETTEVLQSNDQFEDSKISNENAMLPSIRERKLAKAAKKRAKNGGGGGIEMKLLNGKVGQKHKEPFKTVPNGEDEMDIVTRSVQSAVTPASTVNSIRNEIKSGIPDKNVVTSFSGPGRNSRASGSLVDIA